jgi:predicted HicB family RNase H-like nuclease
MTTAEAAQEVQNTAESLFASRPDWVTFYREILGVHGLVRRLYPTAEALAEFEKTEAYHNIQRMLTQLRTGSKQPVNEEEEPTRVITVRMPKSLHESLQEEAYDHRTSMNKLCISKLLRIIEQESVPGRPAPQRR